MNERLERFLTKIGLVKPGSNIVIGKSNHIQEEGQTSGNLVVGKDNIITSTIKSNEKVIIKRNSLIGKGNKIIVD